MKKTLLIALVLTILIGGCATTGSGSAFRSDGIPWQKYYVGGGFSIEYHTQDNGGTLILADEISRKILITKSMTPNDEFETSFNPTAKNMLETLRNLGIDPENMKLSLYFIPNENQRSMKQSSSNWTSEPHYQAPTSGAPTRLN